MSDASINQKYGPDEVAKLEDLYPVSAISSMTMLDQFDQHFAKLWLDFLTGLGGRTVLDARSRHLTRISQLAMLKSPFLLEDAIRAALREPVAGREILEVILQCSIYGGQTVIEPALRVFGKVVEKSSVLDDLAAGQLPLDGRDRERSFDRESKDWHPDDVADPRFGELVERHGWLGVGRGMSLRPKHHLEVLEWHDALDPHWAGLWERFVYQGMYSRGVLDDRIRLLCMVGNCVVVNEGGQGRAHMSGALRAGASPREVMEVILQTAALVGMPTMVTGLRLFMAVLKKEGRLDEVGNPPDRGG